MNRMGRTNVLLVGVTAVIITGALHSLLGERAYSRSDVVDPDIVRAERFERVTQVLPAFLDKCGLAQERGIAYMRLGDVKGGSTDRTHYEWIEAIYVGYGVGQAQISREGRISGSPDFSEMTVLKDVDKATPQLAVACAEGKRIGDVEIHFTQQLAGRRVVYLRITLKDVIVAAVTPMLVRAEGRLIHVEEFSLHYRQIEWEYTPFDERGRASAPVTTAWDVQKK